MTEEYVVYWERWSSIPSMARAKRTAKQIRVASPYDDTGFMIVKPRQIIASFPTPEAARAAIERAKAAHKFWQARAVSIRAGLSETDRSYIRVEADTRAAQEAAIRGEPTS